MNPKIKNVLDAASKYMDDNEDRMFFRSLFAGGTAVFTIYRLRGMYKTAKSYYQNAAAQNALKKSNQTTNSNN